MSSKSPLFPDGEPSELPTPKLPSRSLKSAAYRYYAGFSEDFVRSVLRSAKIPDGQLVLDPWNGSGTTTRVSAQLGLCSKGIDINPVMAVLAKARLLKETDLKEAARAAARLVRLSPKGLNVLTDDPLLAWFDKASVGLIREAETSLIGTIPPRGWSRELTTMTPVTAHCYVGLFLAVRRLLRQSFGTSNPTWFKTPKDGQDKLSIDWDTLRLQILDATSLLQTEALDSSASRRRTQVSVGSSLALPHDLGEAALVLTSPPYCTRIDYAVATRPELAILAYDSQTQNELRRRILGTTTVPDVSSLDLADLVPSIVELLSRVKRHPTKASATYYWKWIAQYFSQYSSSLRQLISHTKPWGAIVLVVQDSYYKDVRIGLSDITTDILATQGWCLARCYSFPSRTTMAGVNSQTRKYRSEFSATEDVLLFRKGR